MNGKDMYDMLIEISVSDLLSSNKKKQFVMKSVIKSVLQVLGVDGKDKLKLMGFSLNKIEELEPLIMKDIQFAMTKDPSLESLADLVCFRKGFLGLVSYRITSLLWESSDFFFSKKIYLATCCKLGIDIHPKAKLKGGVFLDHATGIVIGETASIGENVLIYHGVTLGSKSYTPQTTRRHPNVGSNVIIGAHSSLLGNISIGNNCVIGAGSIVIENINNNKTVVGVKALEIKSSLNILQVI